MFAGSIGALGPFYIGDGKGVIGPFYMGGGGGGIGLSLRF